MHYIKIVDDGKVKFIIISLMFPVLNIFYCQLAVYDYTYTKRKNARNDEGNEIVEMDRGAMHAIKCYELNFLSETLFDLLVYFHFEKQSLQFLAIILFKYISGKKDQPVNIELSVGKRTLSRNLFF